MKLKKILADWQKSNNWARVEPSKECAACRRFHMTGDIVFVFGAVAAAVSKAEYYCSACGFTRMCAETHKPDGLSVFVEKEHLSSDLALMPQALQERVLESFRLIDQLMSHLAKVGAAGQSVSTGKAAEAIKQAKKQGSELPKEWLLKEESSVE